ARLNTIGQHAQLVVLRASGIGRDRLRLFSQARAFIDLPTRAERPLSGSITLGQASQSMSSSEIRSSPATIDSSGGPGAASFREHSASRFSNLQRDEPSRISISVIVFSAACWAASANTTTEACSDLSLASSLLSPVILLH